MKVQSPWIGRLRGSAGNMTGAKVYDKNVMRAKAFEVNNPKTAAQTKERNFFAQVQACCASVSDDQLRSLFGVKPKSMSRRNALSKQLSAAYSVEGGVKMLDFSKIVGIGNGKSLEVQMLHSTSNEDELIWNIDQSNPGLVEMPVGANFVFVIFNKTKNTIEIFNSDAVKYEDYTELDISGEQSDDDIYIYPTYSTDGENVYGKPFGSFSLKTRKG